MPRNIASLMFPFFTPREAQACLAFYTSFLDYSSLDLSNCPHSQVRFFLTSCVGVWTPRHLICSICGLPFGHHFTAIKDYGIALIGRYAQEVILHCSRLKGSVAYAITLRPLKKKIPFCSEKDLVYTITKNPAHRRP
jgi:hypothetical protein